MLVLPNTPFGQFVIFCYAFKMRLICALIRNRRVLTYASKELKTHVRNYLTCNLKLVTTTLHSKYEDIM